MSLITMDSALFRQYVEESSQPVLVEFSGRLCLYCRRLAPAMEKLAEEYGQSLTIGQVDIDREPRLAADWGIEVIPTFLLFRDGQMVDSLVSPEAKPGLQAFLDEHLIPSARS